VTLVGGLHMLDVPVRITWASGAVAAISALPAAAAGGEGGGGAPAGQPLRYLALFAAMGAASRPSESWEHALFTAAAGVRMQSADAGGGGLEGWLAGVAGEAAAGGGGAGAPPDERALAVLLASITWE
jgi:hypothetical protein